MEKVAPKVQLAMSESGRMGRGGGAKPEEKKNVYFFLEKKDHLSDIS